MTQLSCFLNLNLPPPPLAHTIPQLPLCQVCFISRKIIKFSTRVQKLWTYTEELGLVHLFGGEIVFCKILNISVFLPSGWAVFIVLGHEINPQSPVVNTTARSLSPCHPDLNSGSARASCCVFFPAEYERLQPNNHPSDFKACGDASQTRGGREECQRGREGGRNYK